MQLRRLVTYHGPNPFAADPMMVADLVIDPAVSSRQQELLAAARTAIEASGAGRSARGVLFEYSVAPLEEVAPEAVSAALSGDALAV